MLWLPQKVETVLDAITDQQAPVTVRRLFGERMEATRMHGFCIVGFESSITKRIEVVGLGKTWEAAIDMAVKAAAPYTPPNSIDYAKRAHALRVYDAIQAFRREKKLIPWYERAARYFFPRAFVP
jgi:hypothetical protein